MVSEYFQYRLPLESTIRFLHKKPQAYPEPSRTSKVEMFYLFSQKAPSQILDCVLNVPGKLQGKLQGFSRIFRIVSKAPSCFTLSSSGYSGQLVKLPHKCFTLSSSTTKISKDSLENIYDKKCKYTFFGQAYHKYIIIRELPLNFAPNIMRI